MFFVGKNVHWASAIHLAHERAQIEWELRQLPHYDKRMELEERLVEVLEDERLAKEEE